MSRNRPIPDAELPWAVLAALASLFAALAFQRISNVDLWWQLRTGEWIWTEGRLPRLDVLSHMASGQEWIELRWLFCLAAHAVFTVGGPALLIAAQVLCLALTGFCLLAPARSALRSPLCWWALALAIVAASDRFVVRPELVTYMAIPLFLWILEGERTRSTARLWWLIPAQVVWVNSHTLFVFGPVLSGIYAATRRTPRYGAVTVAVTLACFLNPYGASGALFPLRLFGQIQSNHLLGTRIQEFASPFALNVWTPYLWAGVALLGLSAWSFLRRPRSIDLTRVAVWTAFAYLAAVAVRNLSLFAIVAVWATVLNVREDEHRSRGRSAHAWSLTALLLVGAWYVASDRYASRFGTGREFGLGIVESKIPGETALRLAAIDAPEELFHSLGDGSYFSYALPRNYRVYIDGRLEVYRTEQLEEYFATRTRAWDLPSWNRFADGREIATAVLDLRFHPRLLALLAAHPADWPLVHVDHRGAVFVRRSAVSAAWLSRHRLEPARSPTCDDPQGRDRNDRSPWRSLGTARSWLALGSVEGAERCLERGYESHPEDPEIRLLLAQIRRSQGRVAEGDALSAGLSIPPRVRARADRLLAELALAGGNLDPVLPAIDRALETDESASELLPRLVAAANRTGRIRLEARALERWAEHEPAAPGLWLALGRAREGLGETLAAVTAYRQAVRLDPESREGHARLGALLPGLGEPEAGRRHAARAEALPTEEN